MRLEPKKESDPKRKPWLLDLRRFGQGRVWFDTAAEASRYLSSFLTEQKQYGELAWDLPIETRKRYLTIERALNKHGVTLEQVFEEWQARHEPRMPKLVGEAIRECLDAKRKAGRRERAVAQLGYALDSLGKAVGIESTCSEIMQAHVEAWLANPDWVLRTKKGRLIDARTFFSFCLKRGWMVTDPATGIEPITVDEGPPGILTVPQVERLLDACRKIAPRFLPFIVLGVFCGVRPEEIKKLEWRYVSLETGYVEIPAHIAKRVKGGGSRQRRLIKIQPNALAWLKLGGDLPPVSWQDNFDKVRKAAGFEANARGRKGKRRHTKGQPWPKNAMRHSFCSYTLPVFGELKESEWAGHSPEVAISRYRELSTEEEAKKFWALTP